MEENRWTLVSLCPAKAVFLIRNGVTRQSLFKSRDHGVQFVIPLRTVPIVAIKFLVGGDRIPASKRNRRSQLLKELPLELIKRKVSLAGKLNQVVRSRTEFSVLVQ